MEDILFTDTETYSTVDIKAAGTVKYCLNAEMLLAGFRLGDRYETWDYTQDTALPNWVQAHIARGGKVCAHNALFDFLILQKHCPDLSLDQMRDTAALCASAGLPLSLEKAGQALGLPEDKQKLKDGKRLVKQFCVPRKPTKNDSRTRILPEHKPEDWVIFRDEYLRLDIEAMMLIWEAVPNLSTREWQVWAETQRINLDGVPIDRQMCELINSKLDQLIDDESSRFIRMTGVFPTQRTRVIAWLANQGVNVGNLQAATVKDVLAHPETPEHVKEALEARANTAHMSFKKYPAFLNTVCDDGTVKGVHYYHAAHTGRFGGRLIQTQNLTRGTIESNEAVQRIKDGEFSVELVKSAVRGMIHCPEEMTIVDYAGIEARVVQYVANDEAALQVFREGKDPYKWMAEKIFGTPYDEVTDKERFTGKQAILGLGYQMSAKKFIQMVESYGETISVKEANLAVNTYRKTHKKLVAFWSAMNKGAVLAVQRPYREIRVNQHVKFISTEGWLFMTLPSGRTLRYYQPELEVNSWDEETVSYMSVNEKNQFVRTRTYGGKLTENLVQAFARDLLVEAVTALISRSYSIITHIHDEIVVRGRHDVDTISAIMCKLPEWAAGLPLAAEGFTSPRFKKG